MPSYAAAEHGPDAVPALPAARASAVVFPLSDGATTLDLIFDSQDWIHRRVERVEILPTGDCIRHQSVDFTLPEGARVPGSRDAVLIPVGILRKGPLARLDVIGPDGRPAPLLETARNAALAVAVLRALAGRTYQYEQVAEPAELLPALHRLVASEPNDATDPVAHVEKVLAATGSPTQLGRTTFKAVAGQFMDGFLVLVELPKSVLGRRSIIKLAYLEQRTDPASQPRFQLSWPVGSFGLAASYHFEVQAPPLLGITRLQITERSAGGPPTTSDMVAPIVGTVNTVHGARQPRSVFSTARIAAEFVPKWYGVVFTAFVAALVVAVVMTSIVIIRAVRSAVFGAAPIGTTGTALLLAGGGALLTWLSRSSEDWLVAKVLHSPRQQLVFAAVPLFGAACLMTLPIPEPVRTIGWVALAVFAWGVAVSAIVYRSRSRTGSVPSATIPRLDPPTDGPTG